MGWIKSEGRILNIASSDIGIIPPCVSVCLLGEIGALRGIVGLKGAGHFVVPPVRHHSIGIIISRYRIGRDLIESKLHAVFDESEV